MPRSTISKFESYQATTWRSRGEGRSRGDELLEFTLDGSARAACSLAPRVGEGARCAPWLADVVINEANSIQNDMHAFASDAAGPLSRLRGRYDSSVARIWVGALL
jgi:hypothetical protein